MRWSDPDPRHVPLLREASVTVAVTTPNEGFERACRAAGITVLDEAAIQFLTSAGAAQADPSRPVVFKAGVWPGIQRQDPQTASATRSLWLDQNCGLVNTIRALHPKVPPVLGYMANKEAGVSEGQLIPWDALELALVDAWTAGGNYLLAPDSRLLQGVLSGTAEARAAWKKLGQTAAWLRANEALFRQPPLPIVTILADSDMSQEIASLAFRNSVSPRVVSAANPPAPDPARCQVLVAVAIDKPSGEVRKRIIAHAVAGASVVVDGGAGSWWTHEPLKFVRRDADREYLSTGKGQVVAYKTDVEDPGSLALDVIDILTQKRRAARLWNLNGGLTFATEAPPGRGAALLHAINYSRPQELPVLARIQGAFRKATLLTPEAAAVDLRVAPRMGGSEVAIPKLQRVATVVFN